VYIPALACNSNSSPASFTVQIRASAASAFSTISLAQFASIAPNVASRTNTSPISPCNRETLNPRATSEPRATSPPRAPAAAAFLVLSGEAPTRCPLSVSERVPRPAPLSRAGGLVEARPPTRAAALAPPAPAATRVACSAPVSRAGGLVEARPPARAGALAPPAPAATRAAAFFVASGEATSAPALAARLVLIAARIFRPSFLLMVLHWSVAPIPPPVITRVDHLRDASKLPPQLFAHSSFGKAAPSFASQKGGRFCRGSSIPLDAMGCASVHVVISSSRMPLHAMDSAVRFKLSSQQRPDFARRGTCFLRSGAASTHPRHLPAFGRHPEERSDEGPLLLLI